MSLQIALAEVIRAVPDCLAAGLVDLKTSELLGIQPPGKGYLAAPDLLVGTATHLFEGDSLRPLSRLSPTPRPEYEQGTSSQSGEALVLLQSLVFVFLRGRRQPHRILVAVVGAGADLATVLSSAYGSLQRVEEKAP